MGIINHDTFIASNGIEKNNTYISFNNETLYLKKLNMSNIYNVNANYRVYWDKSARDNQKTFIELISITMQISENQLSSSLYTLLYEELKKKYINITDDIDIVSAPEPVPEPTPEPTPEPVSQPTPEPTPEPVSQPTPEPVPEPTPEPTPQPTPEPTPQPTPEPTPEPVPEPTPEPTSETVPVP